MITPPDTVVTIAGALDWNWFYSTLAQSTAALVGILCAFGISRLIGNQGALQSIRGRIDDFEEKAVSLVAQSELIRFDFIQQQGLRRGQEATAKEIARVGGAASPEDLYGTVRRSFSSFVTREAAQAAIEEVCSEWAVLKERGQTVGTLSMCFLFIEDTGPLRDSEKNAERLAIDIEDHIASMNSLMRDVMLLRDHTKIVVGCLIGSIALYVIGVLLPLLCLPASMGYDPSSIVAPTYHLTGYLLLAGVTACFLGMLGYLIRLTTRNRASSHSMSKCMKYARMGAYHKAFETYFNNATLESPVRIRRLAQNPYLTQEIFGVRLRQSEWARNYRRRRSPPSSG